MEKKSGREMSGREMSDREMSDQEMSNYCEPWCNKKGGKIQMTPGVPEVGYGPVWAGAGTGGHLGRGPRIRSSSGGQDEATDTPTNLLGALVRPVQPHGHPYSYVI